MGGKGYQTLSKALAKALSCDSMEAVTIGGGGSSTRNKNIAQGTRNVNMDAAIESDMKQCGGGGGGFTGGDAGIRDEFSYGKPGFGGGSYCSDKDCIRRLGWCNSGKCIITFIGSSKYACLPHNKVTDIANGANMGTAPNTRNSNRNRKCAIL